MKHERIATAEAEPLIKKRINVLPVFVATGPTSIAIRAGSTVAGVHYENETPIHLPTLEPGNDYSIFLGNVIPVGGDRDRVPSGHLCIGGFHFAPGGNAAGRSGGDTIPAINPYSIWDQHFRPECPDPRGMVLIEGARRKFWCDIYLTASDHLTRGTSVHGVTIADGSSPPQKPEGGRYARFDYETAVATLKHHGKGLLSPDEFFAAAYGVTEKTAASKDPRVTGLDAPRTSKFGLMQATGNLWAWGHDGDPSMPRASIFGGSWFGGSDAGSRYANLACWPENSAGHLGARGRSDHLQLD